MIIIYTDNFRRDLKSLPISIRGILKRQEGIFLYDWKDSRLHTKKLKGTSAFSFRVTRKYRVLFVFLNKDTVFLTSIGHRKDIYE